MSNAGQLDASVRYYGRGPGYSIYFTPEEASLVFAQRPGLASSTGSEATGVSTSRVAFALRFLGANPTVRPEGAREQPAKVNFITGNDPAKWHTGLSTYQEVVYPELWPGIDLVFRQAGGRLKYELVVRPGARVEAVRLAYRGVEGVTVDAGGNLAIRTSRGVLTDERPQSHQEIDGKRVPIETRFVLESGALDSPAFGFSVGEGYDPRLPLIIDPGLGYSTLLGGTSADIGHAIAVDNLGNTYVTGETGSADFPTKSAFDTTFGGGSKVHGVIDAFVAKLDPAGTPIYVTYLGGSDADVGLGIAVACGLDPAHLTDCNAFVTGFTYSADFPVFPNPGAFRTKITGGADAFVTKLNAAGSALVYSTFLGGGGVDAGHAIALDPAGNAYVTGETLSSNFPVTPFAVFATSQGKRDAFITKLNPGGSGLVYSTYLGGKGDDVGFGIAVACGLDTLHPTDCNAFVTGQTSSLDFPTTLSFPSRVGASIDTSLSGPTDAFVAKFTAVGSQLPYSTFLGGSGDEAGFGIAVDSVGNAYITGQTNSTNFPFTAGAFQRALNLNPPNTGVPTIDAFVTKINASGTAPFVYSTFLGGSGDDIGLGIALACLDPGDSTKCSAVVTGQTSSSNFPTTSTAGAYDSSYGTNTDAFVTKLKPDGSGLFYSTFFGGSGTDVGGGVAFTCILTDCNAYVTGQTNSHDFPTTTGPPLNLVGNPLNNNADAFVAKLDIRATTTTTVTTSKTPTVFGESVTFTATVTSPVGTPTGTVTFKDGATTLGSGTLNTSGQATFTTSSLSVGSHSITAVYGGDGNFLTSNSSALTQLVNKADSLSAVTASPASPSVFGQSVTFTATVTAVAPGAGTPTGTVTFQDGASTLGPGTLNGSGQATFTTSALSVATHSITATYSGDGSFNATGVGSSTAPPLSYLVNKANTTTAIASHLPEPSVVGQAVTVTWTVTVNLPGTAVVPPGGTMTVSDGTGATCLAAVAAGSCALTPLSAGTKTLTATYSGDGNFNGSAATVSHLVNPRATTTTLSLPPVWTQGQLTTVTVTVTDSELLGTKSNPAGVVTVSSSIASDLFGNPPATSTASCSPAPVPSTSDQSSCTVTVTASLDDPLTISLHTLTASYAPSTSPSVHKSSTGTLDQKVISAPAITGIQVVSGTPPLSTSCSQWQPVYVTGRNFLPSPTIEFIPSSGISVEASGYNNSGSVWAQVLVSLGTDLTSRAVKVTNTDGGNATSASAIVTMTADACAGGAAAGGVKTLNVVVAPAPSISTIGPPTPNGGLIGSNVTINGSNFDATPANNVVKFGGTVAGTGLSGTVTGGSASQLTATVPVGASDGLVSVTINNTSSTSNGLVSGGVPFTITSVTLSGVNPSSAAPLSSVTLTLSGAKFQSGMTVQFLSAGSPTGAIPGQPLSVTPVGTGTVDPTTNLTFFTQATVSFTPTAPTGPLDVKVTNTGAGAGTSTLAGAFQVISPPTAGYTFSVNGGDPASFLPSVNSVNVTLDSTGKCTAKTVTPTAVTLQAQFFGPAGSTAPSNVTFTIQSVSNVPGTATNEDCEPGATPTSDYSFSASDTTVLTSGPVVGGGVYQTTLYSYDWGGTVTIGVSGTATVSGGASQIVSGTITLPVDTDGDGLPNKIELAGATETDPSVNPLNPNPSSHVVSLNQNAAGANILDPLNGHQNGNPLVADGGVAFTNDGLINREKSRGIYLGGPVNGATGNMVSHVRLGIGLKHLFVRGAGFLTDLFVQAKPGTCGVQIPVLTGGITAASTTIPVTSTFGFPASGTALVVSGNTINTIGYTGTTATSFTGVTGLTSSFGTGSLIYAPTTKSIPVRAANVDAAVASSATTIAVVSTLGFPASGTATIVQTSIQGGVANTFSYTGRTPTSFTGVTGITQSFAVGDPIFTDTPVAGAPGDFCPNFEVGPAFVLAGIQVHDVSAFVGPSSAFPQRSFANPANTTLALYTVNYDGVNCGYDQCNHTSNIGIRQWTFATLGYSGIGTRLSIRVFKRPFDVTWLDKPYEHRTNVAQCLSPLPSTGQCYVVDPPTGTPMLAPLSVVGDSNDNGVRDSTKEALGNDGRLASDTLISGAFNKDLSALAVTNDGICIQLPFWTGDPRLLGRCTDPNAIFAAPDPRVTRRQAAIYLVTHELSHAVGGAHTTDSNDLLYQYTINFFRDHYATTPTLSINNKAP